MPIPVEEYRREMIARVLQEAATIHDFRGLWVETQKRRALINHLLGERYSPDTVRELAGPTDCDHFDLFAHYGYREKALKRAEREAAYAYLSRHEAWFASVDDQAAIILKGLGHQFGAGGTDALESPELWNVPEIRRAGGGDAGGEDEVVWSMTLDRFTEIVPISLPIDLPTPPAGWRWEKLTNIARLESGHTPSRLRADWWDGDISWVSLTEIRALDGQWVEETQIRTNEAGIAHSAARVLPRGTVCFSRTASVGFVTIMAKPMATSQDFAAWVCGDELDPEFLMYALIRSRAELRALATGATHKTIYMPTLQAFYLCLPVRATQERIVKHLKARLAAVEEARIAAQAQLDEIERLPARLLAEAFGTG